MDLHPYDTIHHDTPHHDNLVLCEKWMHQFREHDHNPKICYFMWNINLHVHFDGSCFEHAMSKATQYATDNEKIPRT